MIFKECVVQGGFDISEEFRRLYQRNRKKHLQAILRAFGLET